MIIHLVILLERKMFRLLGKIHMADLFLPQSRQLQRIDQQ